MGRVARRRRAAGGGGALARGHAHRLDRLDDAIPRPHFRRGDRLHHALLRRGDVADGGESEDHCNCAGHGGKTDVGGTSSHYHRFMDNRLSHKVKRLSRMELPGAGQVYVTGNTAYVGHITNRAQLGTSILDVSDPKEPRLLAQVNVEEPDSHSHKVRVIGDVMIVNVEQNLGALGRKGVDGSAEQTGYDHGGFKIYD